MSVLSLIAFVTGVAGVWLTIRKNIWCWPVALVSVLSSALEFQQQRLFGDMSLQVVYFAAGIYGWIVWSRKSTETTEVRATPKTAWPKLIAVTLLQMPLYYLLLKHFKGDRTILDAALTACSLSATYMMTMKWKENWIAWTGIDLAYVVLYLSKSMWLFALLYLFFALMAAYGWTQWNRRTY
ncbi:MAG TPA: nicotinamide riboside transporter PnuC [Bacteroidia bacterium]|nr:nicotinamide riboside transporter PnuC [Bacteroidia bacterium]